MEEKKISNLISEQLVSVIIVNWNGKKWLDGCLSSILNQSYGNFNVILIDNGSTDGSMELVDEKFHGSGLRKVLNNYNFGFGMANNIGADLVKEGLLLFLNTDTEVPFNFLEKLVAFKERHKLNIIGPQINIKSKSPVIPEKYMGVDFLGYPGWPSKKLFYIDGCSLMISKRDFSELGMFDKEYFMYGEDIDLCWRARLLGMNLGICNTVEVVHFGGGSSEKTHYKKGGVPHIVPGMRRYEVEKNNCRTLLKNYKLGSLICIIPLVLVQNLCETFVYLATFNFKTAMLIPKAFLWNIFNLRSTMIERKKVQAARAVGDFFILSNMEMTLNKIRSFRRIGLPKFK